jgi:hypothetical protein
MEDATARERHEAWLILREEAYKRLADMSWKERLEAAHLPSASSPAPLRGDTED